MAISWGAEAGHMQVGIDVRHDGYDTNTPSINVYIDFYVRTVGWGANDSQTLNLGGNVGGSFGYQMVSGTGQTTQLHIHTAVIPGQGQNYGGGPTYHFAASVSGSNLGANPSHAINWTLPPRPPNIPTQPGTGIDSITSNSARIIVTAADGRGSGISRYEAYVLTNNAWPGAGGNVVASAAGGTFVATGLQRASVYYYTARALNGVGWSAWTAMKAFNTNATVPDKITSFTANEVYQSEAVFDWVPPHNGGDAIDGYDFQVSRDLAWNTEIQRGIGDVLHRVSGLTPGVLHYARVRAYNSVGAGTWSDLVSFTTLSGTLVMIDGVYVDGVLYVKKNGLWVNGSLHKKVGGAWVTK